MLPWCGCSFLVATELQAKLQAPSSALKQCCFWILQLNSQAEFLEFHRDVLLTIACASGNWMIVLWSACNSCQSSDITSRSLACLLFSYLLFSYIPTLILRVGFGKLRNWKLPLYNSWKCHGVAQLLQAGATQVCMLVNKVVGWRMREKEWEAFMPGCS